MQHADAKAPGRVRHQLPGLPGTELCQSVHKSCQGVVRYGEEDQLRTLHDVLDLQHGNTGQERFSPVTAGIGDSGNSDDGMFCRAEGSTEHRAYFAGTDDSDAEASGLSHAAGLPVVGAPWWPGAQRPGLTEPPGQASVQWSGASVPAWRGRPAG